MCTVLLHAILLGIEYLNICLIIGTRRYTGKVTGIYRYQYSYAVHATAERTGILRYQYRKQYQYQCI